MKLVLPLACALLLGACASAPPEPAPAAREVTPPAPAAVDPVGTFDFSTAVEGMAVNGTMTISRNPAGALEGTITTNITEAIPVRSVTVTGQRMNVVADTPDGPLNFVLEFQGDEFSGTWDLGSMAGTHSGRRRSR